MTKGTSHWRCSTHNSKGCNAKIIVNSQNIVVSACYEHPHPPVNYIKHNGVYIRIKYIKSRFDSIEFVLSSRGNYMLCCGDQMFWSNTPGKTLDGRRIVWYCSKKKSRQCPCSVKTFDRKVLGIYVFYITSRGKQGMIYNNEKYYQQVEGFGIRWRCTQRGCKAYYYERNGIILKKQEVHSHPARYSVE
ncbi:hypothetical protein B5X24_HaOG203953 [Helicoverpa armigera]|uniref:Uncharacterized protein n=1 Tax=Helicoverpa armigera TaxID=29058 RepID=A0A2W1BPN6_HELAM|nr:hypothetical protein B5X24_HaOG203953 [Helicoverpa armigera]